MGDRHRTRALLGFAGFGVSWGAWGPALPLVQDHAGAGDSALGLALLCVGAGALASMRPAGVLVDRPGPAVTTIAYSGFLVGPAAVGLARAPRASRPRSPGLQASRPSSPWALASCRSCRGPAAALPERQLRLGSRR
ncbi:MAG: hypothetical protein ACXW08_08110 [Solirubrobacteraceae bacterium]